MYGSTLLVVTCSGTYNWCLLPEPESLCVEQGHEGTVRSGTSNASQTHNYLGPDNVAAIL